MNYKKEEIKAYAIDQIQELKKYDLEEYNQLVQDGEIHNRLFNEDYYIIGYYQASQWLKTHNIGEFEAMAIVQQYEIDHFGESTKVYDNSESVVNMLAYIWGAEILSDMNLL